MQTIAYRTIDKTAWPRGAWDREPDKVQWLDKASGLPCLAVRHREWGNWCGYVGVSEGHPMYEKGECYFDVHGGVNFAAFCAANEPEDTGICHVAGPCESHAVWWLGFDCGHAHDLQPALVAWYYQYGMGSIFSGRDEIYRTLRYVRRQCRELARQLSGMKQ